MSTDKIKVGLEIHVHVATDRKLFSESRNLSLGKPNTRVSLFDIGIPGTMPLLNRSVLLQGLKVARILKCQVARHISFMRKHYVYKDLPLGYQITQEGNPLGRGGYIPLEQDKKVSIKQVHIECDAAKLDDGGVDYNRSCVPLLEIVTEPDIHSYEEFSKVIRFVRKKVVLYAVSYGEMSAGDLRCDINVSYPGVVRQEIKNINSIKYGISAIKELLKLPSIRLQRHQTWGYSPNVGLYLMRGKETVSEYCYIPEPDVRLEPIDTYTLEQLDTWMEIRTKIISDITELVTDPTLVLRIFRHKDFPLLLRYHSRYERYRFQNILFAFTQKKHMSNKELDSIVSLPRGYDMGSIQKVLSGKRLVTDGDVWSKEQVYQYLADHFNKDLNDFLTGGEKVRNFLMGKLMHQRLSPECAKRRLQEILESYKKQ